MQSTVVLTLAISLLGGAELASAGDSQPTPRPTASTGSHERMPELRIWDRSPRSGHRPPGARLAPVSRTLFLNRCVGDCIVRPGFDDSRRDVSSIADGQARLTAFPHGDEVWNALVQCARETFEPFAIDIVTEDPGNASHFEVMVAGQATQLNPALAGAGGVAPFLSCDTSEDNVISFVFAAELSNLNFMCHAVAQEAAHVWGLDHSRNAADPMTYLQPGGRKVFQDSADICGTFDDLPQCHCSNKTQNSFQFLIDAFGPRELRPPQVTVESPKAGGWVRPGAEIVALVDAQFSVASLSASIGVGATPKRTDGDRHVFSVSADAPGGEQTLTITGTDSSGRPLTASQAVKVAPSCSDGPCEGDAYCVSGTCLPRADQPGGLGASCASGDDCASGSCDGDQGARRCTASCDAENACPGSFECLSVEGGGGVCWPKPEEATDQGGCASGAAPGGLAVIALSLLTWTGRRRRKRR